MDCIFCNIIKDSTSTSPIYEDEHVIVLLDIYPLSKGHLLIIPKDHCETIVDLKEVSLTNTIKIVQKMAKILPQVIKPMIGDSKLSYNILQNNGISAGQSIMHVHFHIIPRLEPDGGLKLENAWKIMQISYDQLEVIGKSLKEAIHNESLEKP